MNSKCSCHDAPTRLFKYRSLSTARSQDDCKSKAPREFTFDIFLRNQLYLAPPSTLNDPFDCRPPIDASDEDIVASLRTSLLFKHKLPSTMYFGNFASLLSDVRKDIEEGSENIFRRLDDYFKILSLSATEPTGMVTSDHILLWSHYADCHRGICLEFDGKLPSLSEYRHKVGYADDARVKWFSSQKEDLEKALTVKASAWSYEKEYRVIAVNDPPSSGGRPLDLEPNALVAVYFGLNVSDEDFRETMNILENSKGVRPGGIVKVFRTSRQTNIFGLKETFEKVV